MPTACPRCGVPADDGARFCASCGAPLAALQGAERKIATMVFADLVGSTRLARGLDPEELRGRLAPFFGLARSIMEEHGGTVEKYIGDAVMAVFGVPRTHGDDPDRAVAAALALAERVVEAGDGLAVRVGVETGEVLALEPGSELTVTGEAVNAAARLQAAAGENEVLVGERTARSCRAARLEPRDPIEAKGFPEPMPAWLAIAAGRRVRREEAPLVGRADDLELLRLVYRRAVRERVPQLVTITGESGIGKTRLAIELVEGLASEDPAPEVLIGRNPPYGRGIAFWALAEILRGAAGAEPDDSVGHVRQTLAARLKGLGAEDADEIAAALAAAIGGDEEREDVEEELRRGWRRLVGLLASRRPVVIALDDAHWADDGLLDLFEELAFRLEDAPLLLLCTARPELLERRPDFGRAVRDVTQIELRPLAPEAAVELTASLLPDCPEDLARRVAAASGGNPFFAEEVARGFEPTAGDGAEGLPDSVQAAVSARLDLLPPPEKRVLQHAAVLGQSFPEHQLAELVGGPPAEELAALTRKALLQERVSARPGDYAFRHQLIRDVAYSSLPRADRAVLHERAAEGIATEAGDRYPELAELVAFHRVRAAELASSEDRRGAAHDTTVEAAQTVFRRGASVRSQELYELAARFADDPQRRIAALRAAADVAARRFRGDESVRLLKAMASAAEEAGDLASAAEAYARGVELMTRMSGITGLSSEDEVMRLLERGRALAEHADPVTMARLVLDEAWLAWRFEHVENLEEPATRALELARGLDDLPLLSSALDAASAAAWNSGRHSKAVEQNLERLAMLDRLPRGDPTVEVERSDALHMASETLTQVGRYHDALDYAKLARDSDLDRGVVYSGWSRAMLPLFYLCRWDEVLAMAQRVREAWNAMDRPPSAFMAGAVSTAGAILGYRGDARAFEDWMAFASDMGGAETPSREFGPGSGQLLGIRTFRADVALHHGDVERALATLQIEARELNFWWRSMFMSVRAEALVRAGSAEAAEALDAADGAYGENPFTRAIALRARGLHQGDEGLLREAMGLFERIDSPYQAARTGWVLGGEPRSAAAQAFARLGAAEPAD